MGFNSGFKGLIIVFRVPTATSVTIPGCDVVQFGTRVP